MTTHDYNGPTTPQDLINVEVDHDNCVIRIAVYSPISPADAWATIQYIANDGDHYAMMANHDHW